jgi:tRNAThr (cytosine32-N3)-methyltransferase
MDAYSAAREAIDRAHSADPHCTAAGQPSELAYADQMELWVTRLDPAATPLLRLAARCQHLERWTLPRSSQPEGKAGYFAWRKALYVRQAERARALLESAGVTREEAAAVATWVSKTELKANAGTQALEDGACLVFLEQEIATFAAQHADYPREKFVEIIRKTWRKMSPRAQELARALPLPQPIAALVHEALAG